MLYLNQIPALYRQDRVSISITIFPFSYLQIVALLLIGRSIVVSYDNILIAYCLPPLSKTDCLECLVAGSPTSLQETGKALLRAKAEHTSPVNEVLKVLNGKFLCPRPRTILTLFLSRMKIWRSRRIPPKNCF